MSRRVLITGGAGFIGVNLVEYWAKQFPEDTIGVIDAITYAANLGRLREVLRPSDSFYMCDLVNRAQTCYAFTNFKPTHVIHCAAESHVCNSIAAPLRTYESNVVGTINALDFALEHNARFHLMSTDEVFGELGPDDPAFHEQTPMRGRSPYAASKAAADLAALSYWHTYKLPITISNSTNNFGPWCHEEKLIPRIVKLLHEGKPVTVYGSGNQVRDWLWVGDHCAAIAQLLEQGRVGQRYCIGGNDERTNMVVIQAVHRAMQLEHGPVKLHFDFTSDRPSDDFRYAVNTRKIMQTTGWRPSRRFEHYLRVTVRHCLDRMKRGAEGEAASAQGGAQA